MAIFFWVFVVLSCSEIPVTVKPKEPETPVVDVRSYADTCAKWCDAMRTCARVTDKGCESDCTDVLSDDEKLRILGLTAAGFECVAFSNGCEDILVCPN